MTPVPYVVGQITRVAGAVSHVAVVFVEVLFAAAASSVGLADPFQAGLLLDISYPAIGLSRGAARSLAAYVRKSSARKLRRKTSMPGSNSVTWIA